MASAAELALYIKAKDQASATLKKLDKALADVEKATAKASKSFSGLGGAVLGGGISGMAGAALNTGFAFNILKENAQLAFTTLLGDGGKAQAMIAQIQATAEKTPFEFEDLTRASQRMLAFGFASEQVIPLLTTIGDAVSSMGGGADMIDRVTLAFGQMKAKGKASAEELMQLAEAGIPVWQILADNIGQISPKLAEAHKAGKVTDAKLIEIIQKQMAKGKLPADMVIGMLQKGMSDRFGGLSEKQSKTASGAMSTFKDALKALLGDLTEGPFKQVADILLTLADALDKIREHFKDLPQPIQTALSWLTTIALAILGGGGLLFALSSLMGGAGFGGLMGALGTVAGFLGTVVVGAIGLLLSPLGLVLLAVGGLALAWSQNWFGIQTATSGAVASVVEAVSGAWKTVNKWFDWLGDQADGAMNTLVQAVQGAWNGLFDWVYTAVSGAWSYVVSLFQWLGNAALYVLEVAVGLWILAFGPLISDVGAAVAAGWEYVVSLFQWLYDTASPLVQGLVQYAADTFVWLYDTAAPIVQALVGYVVGAFQWVYDTAAPIVSTAVGYVAGLFAWLRDTGAEAIAWLADRVVALFSWLGTTAWTVLSTAWTAVAGIFTGLRDTGAEAIKWLVERVVQLFGWAADRVRDIWKPIQDIIDRARNIGAGVVGAVGGAVGGGAQGFFNGVPLPHLANGGIALDPMTAVIGDRPGGEVVMGLDQLDRFVSGGRGGNTVVNVKVSGSVFGTDIEDQVVAALDRARRGGRY